MVLTGTGSRCDDMFLTFSQGTLNLRLLIFNFGQNPKVLIVIHLLYNLLSALLLSG